MAVPAISSVPEPPSADGSDGFAGGDGGRAWFGGVQARRPVECVDLLQSADVVAQGGFWVVVGDFEGRVRAWRFAEVERRHDDRRSLCRPESALPWSGPLPTSWSTSMDAEDYRAGVTTIRELIRAGEVYQVNLCRVLAAPLPAALGAPPDAAALGRRLLVGNPAPYAGGIQVDGTAGIDPVWVVSASPELFLRVEHGMVTSGPIKGTATTASGLTDKDRAENVMIADMVRNDLQRICDPGTVEVIDLLAVEEHPGLVHLVTTVQGRLRSPVPDWRLLFEATYPPASVSGAPKHAALRVIEDLEAVPRGPYCGAFGWIDADAGRAELAVGIRTFWWTDDEGGRLHFGTGAGITWGSDPQAEWAETELKAHRLVALASTVT